MTRNQRRIRDLRHALQGYAGRPNNCGNALEFRGEKYRGENARMALIDDNREQMIEDFDQELILRTGKSLDTHGVPETTVEDYFVLAPTPKEQVELFIRNKMNQE